MDSSYQVEHYRSYNTEHMYSKYRRNVDKGEGFKYETEEEVREQKLLLQAIVLPSCGY